MLKACFDCLAGDQQRQSDERYSLNVNGGSTAPPWLVSNAQTGRMFTVPTQLNVNDEIIIRGNMDDGMIDIALRPDGNPYNVVSQINVIYPDNQTHDQIILRNVVNGTENTTAEYKATDYFYGKYDTTYDVRFIITPDGIRISIEETYLGTIPLGHSLDDIRFISVRGQVKEMNFSFKKY